MHTYFYPVIAVGSVVLCTCGLTPRAHAQDVPANCSVMQEYFAARQAAQQESSEAQREFAELWLSKLSSYLDDGECGTFLESPRWHAVTLANMLEEWSTSRELAIGGRDAAERKLEKAVWQESVAACAFRMRNPADPASLNTAIDELNDFLQIASHFDDDQPASATGRWLIPTLVALQSKATCQRQLEDYVGSAATELRGATLAASVAGEEGVEGSLLAEEGMYRAAVDYSRAERAEDAASTLLGIDAMPQHQRECGRHAWHAVSELESVNALKLCQELISQGGVTDWSPLQVEAVCRAVASDDSTKDDMIATIDLVVKVLDQPESVCGVADELFESTRASAGAPPLLDQAEGHYNRLLQHKARLEMLIGDMPAAQSTMQQLLARGSFAGWVEQMLPRTTR